MVHVKIQTSRQLLIVSKPKGIIYSGAKHGIAAETISDAVTNVYPSGDFIELVRKMALSIFSQLTLHNFQIDEMTGIILHTTCEETDLLSFIACHSLTRTTCHLTKRCGDPYGRVISDSKDSYCDNLCRQISSGNETLDWIQRDLPRVPLRNVVYAGDVVMAQSMVQEGDSIWVFKDGSRKQYDCEWPALSAHNFYCLKLYGTIGQLSKFDLEGKSAPITMSGFLNFGNSADVRIFSGSHVIIAGVSTPALYGDETEEAIILADSENSAGPYVNIGNSAGCSYCSTSSKITFKLCEGQVYMLDEEWNWKPLPLTGINITKITCGHNLVLGMNTESIFKYSMSAGWKLIGSYQPFAITETDLIFRLANKTTIEMWVDVSKWRTVITAPCNVDKLFGGVGLIFMCDNNVVWHVTFHKLMQLIQPI